MSKTGILAKRTLKLLTYAFLALGAFFAGLVSFGSRAHRLSDGRSSLLVPEAHADYSYGGTPTSCDACGDSDDADADGE